MAVYEGESGCLGNLYKTRRDINLLSKKVKSEPNFVQNPHPQQVYTHIISFRISCNHTPNTLRVKSRHTNKEVTSNLNIIETSFVILHFELGEDCSDGEV